MAVETGLTVDRVNEFHEIFSLVDEDHGGSISLEELAKLTDLMNMGATLDEVQSLVDEIDSSGTNNVSFHDFVCSISKVPQVPYSKQDVMEAFKLLAGPASERKHGVQAVNRSGRSSSRKMSPDTRLVSGTSAVGISQ